MTVPILVKAQHFKDSLFQGQRNLAVRIKPIFRGALVEYGLFTRSCRTPLDLMSGRRFGQSSSYHFVRFVLGKEIQNIKYFRTDGQYLHENGLASIWQKGQVVQLEDFSNMRGGKEEDAARWNRI